MKQKIAISIIIGVLATTAAVYVAMATPRFTQSSRSAGKNENKPLSTEPMRALEKEKQPNINVTPLQAREVIERLKTIRAQILLEEEYNALLKARVERFELEARIAHLQNSSAIKKSANQIPALPPPPKLESADSLLQVKAVTTKPYKEAVVVYRGRVYTVRPGDRLGSIIITDINENGLSTSQKGMEHTSIKVEE